MDYTTTSKKTLPANLQIIAGGHVHPGDKPTPKQNPAWDSAREQRGFWGSAPGPSGYYTAWIEYKGEFYFPDGDPHGHRAALLAAES